MSASPDDDLAEFIRAAASTTGGSRLRAPRIHLWMTNIDKCANSTVLEAYERLLSDDETKRLNRFRFDGDRRRFLVSRALLRTTLSRYVAVDPAHWRFERTSFGRPYIYGPKIDSLSHVDFNITHAGTLVAMALSVGGPVGIDIEEITQRVNPLSLLTDVLGQREAKHLREVPSHLRTRLFFQYWTLKEAYLKAIGVGLAISPNCFDLPISQNGSELRLSEPLEGDHRNAWTFRLFSPLNDYLCAMCISAHHGDDRSLAQYAWTVPLFAQPSAAALRDVPDLWSGAMSRAKNSGM